MMTRSRLAELSRELEGEMVLSVYLARENEDPGKGAEWLKRLEVTLDGLRPGIEAQAPSELVAFEKATGWIRTSLEAFGRILPHEGWLAVATEERLWLAEPLSYGPPELVRWQKGAMLAPAVRALKVGRPAVLAVLSQMHANLYRFEANEFTGPLELHAESLPAEATDVGMSKRASMATGVRGVTRTDYAKRTRDESVRRLHKQLQEALLEMAGDEGVAVLGGTQKAISAVRRDLEEELVGRIAEAPDLAFDTARSELMTRVAEAVSGLTEGRQADLLETCKDPHRGSSGWNETYRALAAGAVDTLLVARGLIESGPDDAERLVRLAIAQGAEVEEVGGDLGKRLMSTAEGIAARLRFVPASLRT